MSFVLNTALCEFSEGHFQAEYSSLSRLSDSELADLITDLEPSQEKVFGFIDQFNNLNLENSFAYLELIISGFTSFLHELSTDLQNQAHLDLAEIQTNIDIYSFWVHVSLQQAQTKFKVDKATLAAQPKKKAKSKASTAGNKKVKNSNDPAVFLIEFEKKALGAFIMLLNLDLKRLIISKPDQKVLISMVVKSACMVIDEPENLKITALKKSALQIMATTVNSYDNSLEIRNIILQYIEEEYLAESMSELIELLCVNYNNNVLIDQVLGGIKELVLTDESENLKKAKSISKFLLALSERIPKELTKQMIYLKDQFDSQSYTIRGIMLEVIGNLIQYLVSTTDESSQTSSLVQIKSFFEIFIERYRDKKAYVRVRVLQTIGKLAELKIIPLESRMKIFTLTTGRLNDSSFIVRTNAIKTLTKFVESSPYVAFSQDKAKISESLFQKRLDQIELTFKARMPEEYEAFKSNRTSNSVAVDEEEEVAAGGEEIVVNDKMVADEEVVNEENLANVDVGQAANGEDVKKIRALMRYYSDGVKFCELVKTTIGPVCEILLSPKKAEVVESMNFFVVLKMYGMECAEIGIKKIIHKIWDKEAPTSKEITSAAKVKSAEEVPTITGSVNDHLAVCYQSVYIKQYPSVGEKEDAIAAANNLIRLTFTMNLSELASLEKLIALMIEKQMIDNTVIEALWHIFGSTKLDSVTRRRGALMILSMMAVSKTEIIFKKMDVLLRTGLGDLAENDLILARHSCVALQQLALSKKGKPSTLNRMPMEHPLFKRLSELCLKETIDDSWFPFVQQAINTIYALSENPDVICGLVVRELGSKMFAVDNLLDLEVDSFAEKLSKSLKISDKDISNSEIDNVVENSENDIHKEFKVDKDASTSINFALVISRALFVVGHVAVKQVVHLEAVESDWKRKQRVKEASAVGKTPKKGSSADDLDLVAGTVEDEFTERMNLVRERELIFGEKSIFAIFAPIIVFICEHNLMFDHRILQTVSVLALTKFMCVSSEFCDSNLRLLLTILEKSDDPSIKSNIVIGLGDMAVSFNSLIDQNISYLYRPLTASDYTLKKNTLMVLSHLILNGMIKVKGQISELAKCVDDEDSKISDLAKHFFSELSTKDNAVYNNLPDIISNLSSAEHGVNVDAFKRIISFLFSFVKKSQHLDNLVEKLCLRFKNAENERQWIDISFCLSIMPFTSEKSLKKLDEGLIFYQDKLHNTEVYKHFSDILAKCKKLPKSESKSGIEEYERKLVEFHNKCIAAMETVDGINNIGVKAPPRDKSYLLDDDELAGSMQTMKIDAESEDLEDSDAEEEMCVTGAQEFLDDEKGSCSEEDDAIVDENFVKKTKKGSNRKIVFESESDSGEEDSEGEKVPVFKKIPGSARKSKGLSESNKK